MTADGAHFQAYVPVLKIQELPKKLMRLQAPLWYYSAFLGQWLETPEGFVSDACSIPRVPGVFLLAGDKADEAGYLHDGLYTSQKFEREVCDKVLREAVMAMGYDHVLAEAMYLAVRAFGGSHWELPNVPQEPHVEAWMALA